MTFFELELAGRLRESRVPSWQPFGLVNVILKFMKDIEYLKWTISIDNFLYNPTNGWIASPEDFDTGYIVDRNLQTSLQIVDGNPEVSGKWECTTYD